MKDIILTVLGTGCFTALVTYMLQTRHMNKEKAETVFSMISKAYALLQGAIRNTKNYNDGIITEEQYLQAVEEFKAGIKSASPETLGALMSLNFSKVCDEEFTKFGICFQQFAAVSRKYYETIPNNQALSSELTLLSENLEQAREALHAAIRKRGRRLW